MKMNLNQNSQHNCLKLFLDIHAHSIQTSIFTYSPLPEYEEDIAVTQRFARITDYLSPYFRFDHCKFNNEKNKRNCARLGVYRDYDLPNSYTVESSCYGYAVKSDAKDYDSEEEPELVQFSEYHFLQFGETLVEAIGQQLEVPITEIEKMMQHGLNIELNFALQ